MYPLIKTLKLTSDTYNCLLESCVRRAPLYSIHEITHARKGFSLDDERVAKYVVTEKKELFIASANHRHRELSHCKKLLAAGRIFFNNIGQVFCVSNESLDYEIQHNNSLMWPVTILHLLKPQLIAEQFCILPCSLDKSKNFISSGEISITREERDQFVCNIAAEIIHAIHRANQPRTLNRNLSFFTGLREKTAPESTSNPNLELISN